MSQVKQILTILILILSMFIFSACGALTPSLSGEKRINANEAYGYYVVFKEHESVLADEYQWKVFSDHRSYRLVHEDEQDVIFRALDTGSYTLRVQLIKDNVHFNSEINITVEGPIIIGGHNVPPAPNPSRNSESLSGIDENKDGVRDDVERAIYFQDLRQIERELMMQEARLFQSILVDKEMNRVPRESILERSDKLMGCTFYLYLEHNMRFGRNSAYLEELTFNTDQRRVVYSKYKAILHNNRQELKHQNNTAISCEFNIARARKADE